VRSIAIVPLTTAQRRLARWVLAAVPEKLTDAEVQFMQGWRRKCRGSGQRFNYEASQAYQKQLSEGGPAPGLLDVNNVLVTSGPAELFSGIVTTLTRVLHMTNKHCAAGPATNAEDQVSRFSVPHAPLAEKD